MAQMAPTIRCSSIPMVHDAHALPFGSATEPSVSTMLKNGTPARISRRATISQATAPATPATIALP